MANKFPNRHPFIKKIVQENETSLAEMATSPKIAAERAVAIELRTIRELNKIKKGLARQRKWFGRVIVSNSHCFQCGGMKLCMLKRCLHCQKYMRKIPRQR
ncbi:hypothetical protein [Helicobacter felistomachi]|uniref:hypothetical protein n=1 Tax=Helicobacter felistomachi TaxID=3040201 RepID=UPI002572E7BB|nr:hypothetical protein [Helicobacter sp. NHP21005]